jgi:hypothetical protein
MRLLAGHMDSDSMDLDYSSLQPGDVLLYFDRRSVVDWAIALKTYTRLSHIEIYTGNGMSVASRNGIGVNRYPLRKADLVCVRRCLGPLDLQFAEYWFTTTARGQKYDFKGLLCFTLAVQQGSPDKMFCSEFALRWLRKANVQPFNPDQDADKTPPSLFWVTRQLETVWEKADHF